jgi:oxazoline/thiazoline synthase
VVDGADDDARATPVMPDALSAVLEIAPHLKAVSGPGGRVFLLGEQQRFVLRETVHARLVAAIVEGRRTALEIIDAVALTSDLSPAALLGGLEQLGARGFICSATTPALAAEERAWWTSAGAPAAEIAARLAAAPVGVRFAGTAPLPWLAPALAEAGLRLADHAQHTVVVCDDYLDPTAVAAFDELGRAGRSFLPFKPVGRAFWLGPLFGPAPRGPCWRCLQSRVERNRPVEMYLDGGVATGPRARAPDAALPVTRRLAAGIAAVKLAEALATPERSPLRDHLLTFELPGLETRLHRVSRRPQCTACGDARWMHRTLTQPVLLRSTPRLAGQEGGYRTLGPEETFARCQHLVSPISGAVMRVEPFEGRNHPLRPVYAAGYHLRPRGTELGEGETFFRPALGKGMTPAQARASALAEAVERYASIWQGDEPLIRARRGDLDAEAVAPPSLLNFSASQYAERDGAAADHRHTAPLPFSDDMVIDWVPSWSLTAGARRYLPARQAFNQMPPSPEPGVCAFDPNGHAAGNCREEAILQGFLELVERDAVGIWWYNRLRRPAVQMESAGDGPAGGDLARVCAHYRSLGWSLRALDLTTDLAIPVVAAIAHHEASGRLFAGFGCHLDPTLALQRAVTEAHQVFEPDPHKQALWTLDAFEDPRLLFPRADAAPRRPAELPGHDAATLDAAVRFCVALAAAAGLETIVLDYTRPDLVLSTVKVVVPGLRHFWRRLGPGRLYDVPVALGELERPLRETELNPLPLMV